MMATRQAQAGIAPAAGFTVPEPAWPVERARREGWYFYEPVIEASSGARVTVAGRELLMMGSYSYLGLLGHPAIAAAAIAAIERYGTGTHGVRLLAGTLPLHVELERAVAAFKGAAAAAVFASGFMANLSIISALVGHGDVVFSDRLDHASIVDGCRLSGATLVRFHHDDLDDLERRLAATAPGPNKLVVADAVFSMDGDVFDLPRAAVICRRHGALLMLDEAHSLGVLGDRGTGIEEHFGLGPDAVDVKMGTFSKTIPAAGGYVAASARIVDAVKHRGRGFIYSASLPPASAAAALAALAVLREETWRVRALHANVADFVAQLRSQGLCVRDMGTPIVPVICGDDERAFAVAHECQEQGVFVQAIPSPVVPVGTARLRCCVTAVHRRDDLALAARVIAAACRLHGAAALDPAAAAAGGPPAAAREGSHG